MLKRGMIVVFIFLFQFVFSQEVYRKTVKLMGSRFDITVVAKNQEEGDAYIELAVNEIIRIEKLISSWDPNSQTSLVNRNAGIKPVQVDEELFNLIKRAINISSLTSGAFDITYASMDNIWKFDGSMMKMPAEEEISASVSKVGYKKIALDKEKSTVFLREKGMKIGFGAIGKGYAADKAKKLLQDLGVTGGIINASGDMNTWGTQPNNKSWQVGITNPLNKNKVFAFFSVSDRAVVTSGNYEKYAMLDGQRYSHIIDPRTGMPSKGILSVSVFAPSAELADALATSVFVMGTEVGINFINQLAGVDCVIVDHEGHIHYSKEIAAKNK